MPEPIPEPFWPRSIVVGDEVLDVRYEPRRPDQTEIRGEAPVFANAWVWQAVSEFQGKTVVATGKTCLDALRQLAENLLFMKGELPKETEFLIPLPVQRSKHAKVVGRPWNI